MSFLRRRTGDAGGPSPDGLSAPKASWEPDRFARTDGERVEVRFHDVGEATLALQQLRDLMSLWQEQKRELAAARDEEVLKHAGILDEMTARRAKLEAGIRMLDDAVGKVEAYTRRNR